MQVLSHASNSLSIARYPSPPLFLAFASSTKIEFHWNEFARHVVCCILSLCFHLAFVRVHTKLSEGNSGTSSDAKKNNTRFCTSPIVELHFTVYSFRWHSYYMQCAFTVLIRVIFFFLSSTPWFASFSYGDFPHKSRRRCWNATHTHAPKETKRIRHPMRTVCKSLKWGSIVSNVQHMPVTFVHRQQTEDGE